MKRMEFVVFDTIRDIALILRAFDPGGCTSECLHDEYVGEALDVWNAMKWSPIDIEMLGWCIEQNMLRSFDSVAIRDREMYEQIARACINVRDANQELQLNMGKKA